MKKKTIKAFKNHILAFTEEDKRNIIEKFVKATIKDFEQLSMTLGIAADISGELTNKKTGRKYTITIRSEHEDDDEQEELEKAMSN